MLAVQWDGQLRVGEVPRPEPAANEALIRVTLAGICKTDLELTKGYMGFHGILGHEFVGVVETCSDENWIGKRVAGEINLACEQCPMCFRGLQRHCPNRRVLGILNKDGAMAEYLTLPVANLHEVPEQLPDEVTVFTEPLAAAIEIIDQIHVQPGMSALVIGDGKLGLLVVQVLNYYGCRVTLLGRHSAKLALGARWGAAPCDDPAALEDRYDLVVEATGSPDALALALAHVRPRGYFVLKSTYAGEASVNLAPLVIDEITLIGSRCGRFEPALQLLARGMIETSPLLARRFPLADAIAAFDLARKPGTLKVVLAIS